MSEPIRIFQKSFRARSGETRSGFASIFSSVFTHKGVVLAWMFGGREAVTRKERAVCVLTRPAVFFVFISPQS